MISFISGTLLREESCCKFMLKYDIKSYLRQFTKTLSICFKLNTTHTDLVMCNLNSYIPVPNMGFFQINIFVLLDKISKIYKGVSNQRHWISFPRDDLLQFVKFEFRHVSSFPAFEKDMVKFSVKIP